MNYYKSLVIVLVTFKAVVFVILCGPWVGARIRQIKCHFCRRVGSMCRLMKPARTEEEIARDAQLYGWPTEAVQVRCTAMRKTAVKGWFYALLLRAWVCFPRTPPGAVVVVAFRPPKAIF